MKNIQVFEREKIFYGKGKILTEDHFDALVQYNDDHDQKYFTVIHKGIRFHQYVGVIKVANLVIEILPKLDHIDEREDNFSYWQDVLLKMLHECQILTPSAPTQADLRLRSNSLLDLYFELFIHELEILNYKGLIKRYISKSENAKAVKGKIDFSQHIPKNYVHKERFYVTYKEYSYNHMINQILQKTLEVIDKLTNEVSLKSRILKLRYSLPNLDDLEVRKKHFDRLVFDRKNDKYREALQISELLLLNYSPDIKSGRNHVLALLFDMEQLFEEYVFRRLKKLTRKKNFAVHRQKSKKFWKSRTIRPDIVLEKNSRVYVLDTKWKSLASINPSVDDLRQMFVYNQYFGSERSVLVYPKASNLNNEASLFKPPADLFKYDGLHTDHGCMVYFMPLVSEEGLNYEASKELLEQVDNH